MDKPTDGIPDWALPLFAGPIAVNRQTNPEKLTEAIVPVIEALFRLYNCEPSDRGWRYLAMRLATGYSYHGTQLLLRCDVGSRLLQVHARLCREVRLPDGGAREVDGSEPAKDQRDRAPGRRLRAQLPQPALQYLHDVPGTFSRIPGHHARLRRHPETKDSPSHSMRVWSDFSFVPLRGECLSLAPPRTPVVYSPAFRFRSALRQITTTAPHASTVHAIQSAAPCTCFTLASTRKYRLLMTCW